jgi:serine/threonine protein kinase
MSSSFDPYYEWLGIPPREQPPHHYRLLGLDLFESHPDVIAHAADRQMRHVQSFQSGKRAVVSQKLLNELAAARVCLLDGKTKAEYDARLAAKVARSDPRNEAADAKPSAGPAADGAALGEYLLLDLVGTSKTGQVFKARHRAMGRVVALKVLSKQALRSRDLVERFRRKIKILAGLSHPNLVAAYDAGERDGTHYLIMEFVDGRDLARVVKDDGLPPVENTRDHIAQAAAGLGYLHAHNIYHRNVKPGNLLLDRHGVVKVIGLGMARMQEQEADPEPQGDVTQTGFVLGTPDFMSPEQAFDSRSADHRSDIYSLGCTLYALLTGSLPYPEKSQIKKMLSHRNDPIPAARAKRPEVTPELDAILARMMAKDPDDRFATMEDVAAALRGQA